MAETGSILLSPLEDDPKSTSINQDLKTEESNLDNTGVADPALVPHDSEDDTTRCSSTLPTQVPEINRLAIIRGARNKQGLNTEEANYLERSIRDSTARAYDNGWLKWVTWCKENQANYDAYDVDNVLKFLVAHQNYSTQHLNTLRSSVASVFRYPHPDKPPIASNLKIQDFFAAKRRKTVKVPSIVQMETWDTDILVQYIKQNWRVNENLTLEELQLKTMALLCLTTMARSRSDMGRLRKEDVIFRYDQNKKIKGAILHFREAKETQVKSVTLGVIEDEEMCPVVTSLYFVQRTTVLRACLPKDHTLFLAYINEGSKTTSIRPSTLSNWMKRLMQQAGITTEYKVHSIRAAASTKAIEKGNSIQEVKKHANWSLNTNTFETFYYKPSSAKSTSTKITVVNIVIFYKISVVLK
ncbi:hypothetical protein RO3G_16542 [Rhizopus delemar RA 99-880]|uniref:Tyr recombinase domain-containing protein n=3 Tax=Rhizopus TaxID=4842 RepID=I1CTQ1_RHIO9|nr:hypothetical protein RO3G_16542 [Rhizopus delemar RA 99-880]|eukprot:EIE91831.1 hypothetical protein RO3G_16542 [Rhizopus delemar RA 99-880]